MSTYTHLYPLIPIYVPTFTPHPFIMVYLLQHVVRHLLTHLIIIVLHLCRLSPPLDTGTGATLLALQLWSYNTIYLDIDIALVKDPIPLLNLGNPSSPPPTPHTYIHPHLHTLPTHPTLVRPLPPHHTTPPSATPSDPPYPTLPYDPPPPHS